MKYTKLMNMGAFLSRSGLIVLSMEPEESKIIKTPVIFLRIGRWMPIKISFRFKNLFFCLDK
jgi:hypothetical protein